MTNWQETNSGLVRRFSFNDFSDALKFVNKLGVLAESEGHHPDIKMGWGYAEVVLITHSKNAITDKDYELAAKIDKI